MPEEWGVHVRRWLELTEPLRAGGAPDDLERYFVFQTLVGAWPIEVERIESYVEKALREAKRNTSWISPDADWEGAVKAFCRSLYSHQPFLADFEPFVDVLAGAGEKVALRQLVLKLTAPGIPDIYQGDELAYRALVDPDNRRPVDWSWRQAMLKRLMGGSPPDGASYKLWLILRLLTLRARRPEPFRGGYEPVAAGDDACAYVRGGELLVVVAIAARDRPSGRIEAPAGRWGDVLGGGERSFNRQVAIEDVVDENGLAVFERVSR
jgi:(1->4)-alpha-D-glucan 1-alpha-D-glucosylmutase